MRSIFCIHLVSDIFARLAADFRLQNVVRYLLADDVYIHQSRVNFKPGFRGKE
ncbi:MAG: ectoine hydroxylase, partial [Nitrospinaceae bacterium]|nr:ectoine hydroxylase [Nitrospinaceae bacterium]